MVIDCVTCGDKAPGEGCCNSDPKESYGATNRDYAANHDDNLMKGGKTVNFISVNQIGYFTNYAKIATLGDNKGDILYGATTIDLSGTFISQYSRTVCSCKLCRTICASVTNNNNLDAAPDI